MSAPRQILSTSPGDPGDQAGPVAASARFVVTVGTDHHPFDRLIGWVNDWLAGHQELTSRFFVQSGTAATEPACGSERFLDVAALSAALDEADVLICHGGPGSIADAWQRGMLPIVVPRLRRLGEVVDDHQVDFCRKLAALGRVRLAEDAAALGALIEAALADPASFRAADQATASGAAVERFSELVDELLSRPRRSRRTTGEGSRRAGSTGTPDRLGRHDK